MYKEKSYIVRDHDQISNNLSDYLQKHDQKDMLRFLTCGGVDDGKSTLIGRLLYDSQMIYEDQMSSLMRDSRDFGTTNNNFDPALLTDGLRAEREQGITIDVAYRYFSTEKRSFIVCDCPGHEQYTRNMATGASHCNLAIILIDACRGVMPQTKRHSFIASVMGIKHIVVAVNKMDIMDYDQQIYHDIRNSYEAFAAKLEVNDIHFIPVSALKGDNIVNPGGNMPWFKGEPLLSYLENVRIASDRNLIDFRFPVQYVLRHDNNFRGFAGTVASGSIRKGDRISVLPSGTPTRVRSIITCDGELNEAFAPQPVLITTTDEVEISRGCMLARPNNAPMIGSRFDAVLVWMDNDAANPGTKYLLKSATQTVPAEISEIRYKFDINTLHRQKDKNIRMNDISRVEITTHRPLCFDYYARNRHTGSFILIDIITNRTLGAGIIIEQSPENHHVRHADKEPRSKNIFRENTEIGATEREKIMGRRQPFTVWLTGLSGSGKSTIAKALQREIISMGIAVFILDGDNVRHGLNKDLGFSTADRNENIRRISEVAKLMNDAGLFVITSFISPFREDRSRAREVIGKERFIEVFIDADLETCRERDPKGLYKKVMEGEISDFTGIDSPYEKPLNAEIVIKTEELDIRESVKCIISELTERNILNIDHA